MPRTALLAVLGIAAVVSAPPARAADGLFPDPAVDIERSASKRKETAVLAGGCFWCTEAVFEELTGVRKVVSGYSGGTAKTARYHLVSSGQTDHAEAVEITYDPAKISYGQLLKVFFSVAHDPTQLNRQGPDIGRQYRSAVFYRDPEQKRIAEAYLRQLAEAKVFSQAMATEVSPLNGFYAAEEEHQDFVRLNPEHRYVVTYAIPKLQKIRKTFPGLVRK